MAPESLEARWLFVGDITGVVFDDANANGVDDPAENGIPGWTVYADTNNDGIPGTGEPTTVTDTRGRYALLGLPAGTVTVREIPQGSYLPTPGFSTAVTTQVREGREVRVKFPNVLGAPATAQVVGTIFEDLNENGTRDVGESSLENWTVFVDSNNDGLLNAGEQSTVSDTDGDYILAGLPAGLTTVREIPRDGMRPSVGGLFPLEGAVEFKTVTLTAGGSAQLDFGNLVPPVGNLQGVVWNDANGDLLRGTGEAGLAGRLVYVDLDRDGLQDPGEPGRISDATGGYAFQNIRIGSYQVREVLPVGWEMTSGRTSAVVTSVGRGGTTTVDFLNLIPQPGSVEGALWDDADGNGLRAATETPLAGWQVYLDQNANGLREAGEATSVTDASGTYRFTGVSHGATSVRAVVPTNWLATNPTGGVFNFRLLNGEQRTGVNLGIRERVGTIQGTVWNDSNGDRIRGTGESGLAGWTVFLDSNSDGLPTEGEVTTLTDELGGYRFSRVPVGTQRVVEVVPAGWITAEGKPASVSTTVALGGTQVADFYNLQPVAGSVQGKVWSDTDFNGIVGPAELGLVGWQVYADINTNGTLDAGEPAAISDELGGYVLNGVPYGTQVIREVVQPGYTPTNFAAGTASVFLLNGDTLSGLNFGNREPADFTISGTAFHDQNRDGIRDPGERGLGGITVFLDINNNGSQDAGEPTTVTSPDLFYTPAINEAGNYAFTHLTRGTYQVRETLPADLEGTPIEARVQSATVGPASALGVNFANQFRPNEIHGVVYDDTNHNSSQEAHELGRSGVTVYLDLDRDDVYDLDEPRTVTGEDGSYAFTGLTPGAYVVREHSPPADPRTYPTTGGGVLWPPGTDHSSVGNVSPTAISTVLSDAQSHRQTVSLTLPGAGSLSSLVDVFLLFDDTGSFTSNSPIVRAAFPTIISTLQASLPGIDLGFGVGRFEEYGSFAAEVATGRPFILNQPIVSSATPGFSTSIQAALDRVAPGYGGDMSETDIEALFQLVTGAGFDGNNNGSVLDSGPAGLASTQVTPGTSGDVPNFASFTPDPAHNVLAPSGSLGGGGFRSGALPVVLLATDTGFAYQPRGETVITGTGGLTLPLTDLTLSSRPTTPFGAGAGIQDTVTALNALGALVIGLGTNPLSTAAPRSSLEALAKLTGAVNRTLDTIPNGTVDAIAPGDPFYFQISSGFGTTVADGVIQAIRNAVTNVALDLEVRASDPRIRLINHTGTVLGVGGGQTATFDVEFLGDGKPHRFDLQFVRAGTSVVVGSIPVTIGTPVVGEGYHFDDLEDGEIHRSSHYGHYVANVAPSFTAGADVSVPEDAGSQVVTGWATNILAGPARESRQSVAFRVTVDRPELFASLPTVDPTGTLRWTGAANAFGEALVTVVLSDNGGTGPSGVDSSAPQTFRLSLTAVNDPPAATPEGFTLDEGTTLTVAPAGVLANDTDVEASPLTAVLVDFPAHGTVVLNGDGSFSYTPAEGFSGSDLFTYAAHDGAASSAVVAVSLTVRPRNHEPVSVSDNYSTLEDTSLVVSLPGVLANDSDLDGNPLTAVVVSGPAHGSLTLQADGSFVYIPTPNYSGSDQFTYVAWDHLASSLPATVNLVVVPVNDIPVPVADGYSAQEDLALAVPAPGLLGNDVDVDGDLLRVVATSLPSHGTLTWQADGSFVYQPDSNYFGPDSFTYQVSDGTVTSTPIVVTLAVAAVNDAPVATDDTYSTAEDRALTIAAPGVLSNDADVDSLTLQAVRVNGPLHGTLTLSAAGAFTYTPAANYFGSDSFTYRVTDGTLSSTIATVNLTVTPVNDVPVAVGDVLTTNEGTTLRLPARGVLANDSDVEGDLLTAVLASGPSNGTLILNADGSLDYTPAAGFAGVDFFTYRAADGSGESAPATVQITVVPVVPATKFFVVDADSKATFQYAADGRALSNAPLNKSDSKPRGIASNATGTTQWVMDGSGTVFVYDSAATLLGQWQPQNVGKPEGITVWGTDLWVVDPNQDRVFYFAGGANLRTGRASATSSFPLNSANLNATDLVTDGSHIWVTNDTVGTDAVFRYSRSGVLEGSWTLPTVNPSPTGLTLDPANVQHLWIVDASNDRVYQYDGATTRVSGTQSPSVSFALAVGNGNAQGIADPLPRTVEPATSEPTPSETQLVVPLASSSLLEAQTGRAGSKPSRDDKPAKAGLPNAGVAGPTTLHATSESSDLAWSELLDEESLSWKTADAVDPQNWDLALAELSRDEDWGCLS